MKKCIARSFIAITVLASAAFGIHLVSIFEQLQIAEQEAKDYILSDFTDGTLNFPYSDLLKKLAVNKRSEAVKEIGNYIRKYTESPEFEKAFQAAKESMSSGDRPEKKSMEQLVSEKKESLKQDIKSAEEDMKSARADMKKLYEETLKQLRENLAALENPAHPKHKMYLEDLKDSNEEATASATSTESNFPETSRELIKQRLKEFLSLTADIDWEAKLVESGRLKKFADPKLEAKGTEWKRCFRAGKETITAARAFAQSWLASLK